MGDVHFKSCGIRYVEELQPAKQWWWLNPLIEDDRDDSRSSSVKPNRHGIGEFRTDPARRSGSVAHKEYSNVRLIDRFDDASEDVLAESGLLGMNYV